MKKLFKMNKNKYDNIFLIILLLIMMIFLCNALFNQKDINYYENRTANKIPTISINKILDKTYQDDLELALSDQIPYASHMKKVYNFLHNIIVNTSLKLIFKDNYCNKYINITNSISLLNCTENLVYDTEYLANRKTSYDNRIENINNMLSKSSVDTYIYYIEKDTDIDFTTETKNDVFNYLKENINTNNIYKYEINNFLEYSSRFYKTDHHWNYKGSYLAYKDLTNILTNDNYLEYKDSLCLKNSFSGSKAGFTSGNIFYKEDFCFYTFDYPNYDIYINSIKKDYGNYDYYINNLNDVNNISYGEFYGNDYAEIIFDNHDNSKENILIIGESYDNAILKLLASHFNKTYSIDLRHYEREFNKEFNYLEYINDNNIDKVLLIGNVSFFFESYFNVEV